MKKTYCKPLAQVLFYTKKDIITESLVYTSENDVIGGDLYDNLFS